MNHTKNSMHIGLDVSSLIFDRGVSRYTANLARALIHEPRTQLTMLGYSGRRLGALKREVGHIIGNSPNARASLHQMPPQLVAWLWRWNQWKVRSQISSLSVFHSWDWLQPPDRDLPLVSTIHDLAILKFPSTAHPKILAMHRRSWAELKRKEAQIIAVSRATRKDIIELLDIPADRVHLVYEALPTEVVDVGNQLTEEVVEMVKARLHLDKPFVLSVGTQEPRKNIKRLIEAWEPLSSEVDLVIAGASGWESKHETIPAALLKKVRFVGKVSSLTLAALYTEAAVFAYPSLYEGFGLPILEAFHFGAPVVTSDMSAMPEVAGNAAELVDPESPEDIRRGISKILNESSADQKQRLQKMVLRLQLFDWQKVARQTRDVYQKAIDLKT